MLQAASHEAGWDTDLASFMHIEEVMAAKSCSLSDVNLDDVFGEEV